MINIRVPRLGLLRPCSLVQWARTQSPWRSLRLCASVFIWLVERDSHSLGPCTVGAGASASDRQLRSTIFHSAAVAVVRQCSPHRISHFCWPRMGLSPIFGSCRKCNGGTNVTGHLIFRPRGRFICRPSHFAVFPLPSTLPAMPGRKVGRGSSKPLKTKASKPVKVKASKPVKVKAPKPVTVEPVRVKPGGVRPVGPGKVAPAPRFVAPQLPPLKIPPGSPLKNALSLPQRIEVAPRKSVSSSSPSLKSSSKSPFLSNPSAHYPPAPSRFPGPSSTPGLGPSKSVPDLAGMRYWSDSHVPK